MKHPELLLLVRVHHSWLEMMFLWCQRHPELLRHAYEIASRLLPSAALLLSVLSATVPNQAITSGSKVRQPHKTYKASTV